MLLELPVIFLGADTPRCGSWAEQQRSAQDVARAAPRLPGRSPLPLVPALWGLHGPGSPLAGEPPAPALPQTWVSLCHQGILPS